jgi:O-antigen ligase
MNLFGHKERPVLWERKIRPHNAMLGIAYFYGVFAIVPYLIMIFAMLIRTYRQSKWNFRYSSIPFYFCVAFVVMSLIDNVEQPFVWLPWFCMYMTVGSVFSEKRVQHYKKSEMVEEKK